MTSIAPLAALSAAPRTASLITVAGLSTVMLMPSLDTSIANAALPELARAFGATFHQAQWIVLSYLLSVTTLVVGAGRLGDVFGRRRVLLIAIGVFTVASVVCGLAPSLSLMLVARSAQGVAAAAMMTSALASVGDTVPKTQTGATMGLLGSMSAVGTALGPSLGGFLTFAFGWPAIFLVNVPIGIAAFAAIRRLPADHQRTSLPLFDVPGTALLALTLGAVVMVITRVSAWDHRLDAALTLTSLMACGAFAAVERRVANPLIPAAALAKRAVSVGLIGSALVSAVMMTTLVIGPFYLTRGLGLTVLSAGFVLSIGPVVSALTGLPAGHVVDRIGARRMTIAGLGGIAGGAAALALSPRSFGIVGYAVPIAAMTSSYAMFQAANNTVIMSSVAGAHRGAVAGLLSLSRNLGLTVGAAAMGAIFAQAVGGADLVTAGADAITAGMRITFGVATLVIVAAIVITSGRRSVH